MLFVCFALDEKKMWENFGFEKNIYGNLVSFSHHSNEGIIKNSRLRGNESVFDKIN